MTPRSNIQSHGIVNNLQLTVKRIQIKKKNVLKTIVENDSN